jgi:hypothetical protein
MGRIGRRDMLRNSLGLSGAALIGGISYEDRALMAQLVDQSGYGIKKEPVKGLPQGKFGQYDVSRLIIGGNLISGSAHAGELIYQSALMTHYFNTDKILETWQIAEENGINTTLMRADPHIMKHYTMFRKERGGKLQWVATSAPEQGDPVENAKHARDTGAIAMYLHGNVSDEMVRDKKVDELGRIIEGIKKTGIMAGVGAHQLDTARGSEQAHINPDFYMVTCNHLNYYSSEAAEIAVFMRSIKKPWIAFKVLGAGRVQPAEGFRRAFENGADFLAVGMFDWQVRDDVLIVRDMLSNGFDRERIWV